MCVKARKYYTAGPLAGPVSAITWFKLVWVVPPQKKFVTTAEVLAAEADNPYMDVCVVRQRFALTRRDTTSEHTATEGTAHPEGGRKREREREREWTC